jgi:hypothetical protein
LKNKKHIFDGLIKSFFSFHSSSSFIKKGNFFAQKHVLLILPKTLHNGKNPHPLSPPKIDQASISHHKLFGMPFPLCSKIFLFALE